MFTFMYKFSRLSLLPQSNLQEEEERDEVGLPFVVYIISVTAVYGWRRCFFGGGRDP